MLNRIVMNIVDMSLEIIIIPDHMLPVAPLPYSSFSFYSATSTVISKSY